MKAEVGISDGFRLVRIPIRLDSRELTESLESSYRHWKVER